jgi:hypothetical protein
MIHDKGFAMRIDPVTSNAFLRDGILVILNIAEEYRR